MGAPTGFARRGRGAEPLALVGPLALVATLFAVAPARAHPLAPALLELREADGGRVAVHWKRSRVKAYGSVLEPVLPPGCRALTRPEVVHDETSVGTRWTVECGPGRLVGARVGVAGLETAGIPAVVRVELADGRLVEGVVSARQPFVVVPERPRPLAVVRDYVLLGASHVLSGPDHLLFVFGLLLLAGTFRPIVAAVTGFTVGHSVTLCLAVLDLVRVPAAAAELMIALSVLALALELARRSPGPTYLRRRPWAMALAFGLLHGLGFAAALREAGLPPGAVPLALGSFNAGIEAGQLGFVVIVLAAWWVASALPVRLPGWAARAPVYVMGSLAAAWCFERAAALLSS